MHVFGLEECVCDGKQVLCFGGHLLVKALEGVGIIQMVAGRKMIFA